MTGDEKELVDLTRAMLKLKRVYDPVSRAESAWIR
jgi:hypothetical protein